jgi:hypothetical protein
MVRSKRSGKPQFGKIDAPARLSPLVLKNRFNPAASAK